MYRSNLWIGVVFGLPHLTGCAARRGELTAPISGRSGPPSLKFMIYQSNDIGWKVGRFGNDGSWKRDRREHRFGQRRFDRDRNSRPFAVIHHPRGSRNT